MKTKSGQKVSLSTGWNALDLPSLRKALADWYKGAKRDLPWRRTRDPYAITVSELMLQQTQVITVIPYYERWLAQFPNWHALASASQEVVLKAWEGLGYYTRARNLHAMAKILQTQEGRMPTTTEGLRSLPGIGPYTSAAIGSIAFNHPVAVLDGNVMRVITRLLAIKEDIGKSKTQKHLQALADDWLNHQDPGEHNQAVMELGATVCLPRNPMCLICPLKTWCQGKDAPENYPVKLRPPAVERTETIAVLRKGDQLYLEQVEKGKPWAGLWRFPDFDPLQMRAVKSLMEIKYGITKYRVTMKVIEATWSEQPRGSGCYLTRAGLEERALAAPHRKLIVTLNKKRTA